MDIAFACLPSVVGNWEVEGGRGRASWDEGSNSQCALGGAVMRLEVEVYDGKEGGSWGYGETWEVEASYQALVKHLGGKRRVRSRKGKFEKMFCWGKGGIEKAIRSSWEMAWGLGVCNSDMEEEDGVREVRWGWGEKTAERSGVRSKGLVGKSLGEGAEGSEVVTGGWEVGKRRWREKQRGVESTGDSESAGVEEALLDVEGALTIVKEIGVRDVHVRRWSEYDSGKEDRNTKEVEEFKGIP
ncbi:hypothetical protein Tco_0715712 [Tanacetum coccineum]